MIHWYPNDSNCTTENNGGVKTKNTYGVTCGIDFVDIACMLNFNLPSSLHDYTHHAGQTAHVTLSFVVPNNQQRKNKTVGHLETVQDDEVVFTKIEKEQSARGCKIKEYNFDMKQVEAFRYQMEDALRLVTRSAIKGARI